MSYLLKGLAARLGLVDFDYRLSVCAIFKNESAYLHDWLQFHEGVGVDHFFLYNNDSTDDFHRVLRPWIDRERVTLKDWPGKAVQMSAYNDCLRRIRHRSRWIAFIDADEFLFAPSGDLLPHVLRAYAGVPAIFVYWHLFGSSGQASPSDRPVVESYLRRFDLSSGVPFTKNTTGRPDQGKSVVDPRLVRRMGIHAPEKMKGQMIDEQRRPSPVGSASRERHSTEVLRINHYWARSLQDLRDKASRGRASNGQSKNFDLMVSWDRQINQVEDRTILPIWEDILRTRS